MKWETTITNKGLSTLASLDDNRVAIVAAWAGTGIEERLSELTVLKNPKQLLSITQDGKEGNKRILRLQILNDQLSESYTLNQLGIYICVDGGEPFLYFVAQNRDGDVIPSKEAVSNFVAEYVVSLIFSMNSDVIIDCPQMPFVTADALDAKIGMLMGMVPIDGGTFFEEYEPFDADGGHF